jgi:hypothetical protein
LVVNVGRFEEFTPAAVRNTLKARRFYATFNRNLRLTYTADGNWMGSRLQREAGQTVTLLVQAEDSDAEDQISRVEIYGSDIPEPTCDFHQFDEVGDRKIVLKAAPLATSDFDSESGFLEVSVIPPLEKSLGISPG